MDDRYNADSPEIKATGTVLKDEFTDNKIQAWIMSAEAFPEKDEIMEFLKTLKKQFDIFRMENGI